MQMMALDMKERKEGRKKMKGQSTPQVRATISFPPKFTRPLNDPHHYRL